MAPSQSSLERLEQILRQLARQERDQKGGLLELVDGILSRIDELGHGGVGLRPLDRTARLERDSVGLPLDALGARRMACRVNAAISPIGNIAGHSRGDIASETELADDGGEQSAFVALDATHQVDFERLAHRARRTPLAQGFGRQPERGLEKFKRCLPPEHVAQLLAEADAGGRSLAHGRSNQLDAAELKKATVTDLMPRGPIQQNNGIAIADQPAQSLARLVPVDKKNQRRADRFEKRLKRLLTGFVAAADEVEGFSLGEALGPFLAEPAPFHRKCVEQTDGKTWRAAHAHRYA